MKRIPRSLLVASRSRKRRHSSNNFKEWWHGIQYIYTNLLVLSGECYRNCALQQLRIQFDERLLPDHESEIHSFWICFSSPCSNPTIPYYVFSILWHSICNATFILRVSMKRCCMVFQDFKNFLYEPFFFMNHCLALHPRCASSLWMVACFFSSAFYSYPYILAYLPIPYPENMCYSIELQSIRASSLFMVIEYPCIFHLLD